MESARPVIELTYPSDYTGLPIGEFWRLAPFVAHLWSVQRRTALVTVRPRHLIGGSGSPADPVVC